MVIIPSLNPTGHIARTRKPIFEDKDPNRCWPEYKPKPKSNNNNNENEQPKSERELLDVLTKKVST